MNAAELKIDNLLGWGNNVVTVKGIHTDSIIKDKQPHIYVSGVGNTNYYCLYLHEVSPIPLTEELLLKFGVTRRGGNMFNTANAKWGLYAREGYFKWVWFSSWAEHILEIEIQYVHQLQNLYFALTGTELTLKP